jgi:prepilin-type N-terminal cleavage/methylation domain-containing protein
MPPSRAAFRRGFTLTEMLVAIGVMLILLAIIFNMMGVAFRLTDTTSRSADSSIAAREVLDRIGKDVTGMLIRPDIDQYYVNAVGNDKMFFYSYVTGYFTSTASLQQGPVSLVGYRISTSANASLPPQLERLTQGIPWTGTGSLPALPFLVFPAQTSTTPVAAVATSTIPSVWNVIVNDPDTAPSFWHTIGSQVFRFEVCYQLRDGSFTQTAPTPSTPPPLSTSTTSPVPPVAGSINDTIGFVVAIAVLDAKSRQIVQASSWPHLIAALPDPTAQNLSASPPLLMDSIWNSQINQTTFAQTANIPATAAQEVRVYQRYYPLNPPQAH